MYASTKRGIRIWLWEECVLLPCKSQSVWQFSILNLKLFKKLSLFWKDIYDSKKKFWRKEWDFPGIFLAMGWWATTLSDFFFSHQKPQEVQLHCEFHLCSLCLPFYFDPLYVDYHSAHILLELPILDNP